MNNLIANAALSNLIHIPHTTDTKLTQLSEGQLLRATVQRMDGDTALLNIGGKAITVKTEVPLQPQQRVILQVAQANTDQISLQIVSQSAAPGAAGAQTAAVLPNNLELLLSSWGLEADPTNQLIAKALFQHAHSLDPEAVQTVRSMWQQLPALAALADAQGGKAAMLETLAYLHTNQLPVNQESLTLAHHLLNNPIDVAQRLTDLQQALRTVQSQLQTLLGQAQGSTAQTTQSQAQAQALIQSLAGQSNTAPLNQLLTTINSALNQMGSWTISADTPPAEIAARLANLITNLGTPPETSLARQVAAQLSTPQPGPANGAGPGGPTAVIHQAGQQVPDAASQPAKSAGATSQPAAANQPNAPAAPAGENGAPSGTSLPAQAQANQTSGLHMSAQIRPGGAFENPLQQLAATLSEALSNPNLDEPTAQALRTLSHQLETISKDLGAIQFSNLANAPEPATEPYYLFPIPLATPDGTQTAQLKVYRRHQAGKLDPDNLRLALLLDLPEIGEIAVNLTVFKKHLNGQFLSRRESTHQLVATSLDELQQSLSDLGYLVDALTSDLLAADKPLSLDEPEPLESIEVPMPQINITA